MSPTSRMPARALAIAAGARRAPARFGGRAPDCGRSRDRRGGASGRARRVGRRTGRARVGVHAEGARNGRSVVLRSRRRRASTRALATDAAHYGALRDAGLGAARPTRLPPPRSARPARPARIAPHDWWNYGNLADACIELGYYRSAARATDRMVALRPGVPAYTRVAALRALDRRPPRRNRGARAGARRRRSRGPRGAGMDPHLSRARALGASARSRRPARAYEAALAAVPGLPPRAAGPRSRPRGRGPSRRGDRPLRARAGRRPDRRRPPGPSATFMPRPAIRTAPAPRTTSRVSWDASPPPADRRSVASWRCSSPTTTAISTTPHACARAEAAVRDDVYTRRRARVGALQARRATRRQARDDPRALRLGTEEATFHRHAAGHRDRARPPRAAARHARLHARSNRLPSRNGPLAHRWDPRRSSPARFLLVVRGVASAHPLGNFTTNRQARITVEADRVSVRYVVDVAEIPTYRVLADGTVDGGPQRSRKRSPATCTFRSTGGRSRCSP